MGNRSISIGSSLKKEHALAAIWQSPIHNANRISPAIYQIELPRGGGEVFGVDTSTTLSAKSGKGNLTNQTLITQPEAHLGRDPRCPQPPLISHTFPTPPLINFSSFLTL
uniref:Uncharacterized protein n=1 Tax=Sphaerodactylus townsendi TaxID=933632 RepID=A0ACB8G7Y6_9SAUR